MEEIYNANLVEVEQQHKAFLTSPLFFFFFLPSGCNLHVAVLLKEPV